MQNVTSLTVAGRVVELQGDSSDESWKCVEEFALQEIKKLNLQVDDLMQRTQDREEMDFDDKRLRKKIEALGKRSVSLDQIYASWLDVTKPERDREAAEDKLFKKTIYRSSTLKFFVITNARGNKIYILADDANVARHIACSNGRIKTKDHGNLRVHTDPSIETLPFGNAVFQALEAGWPGEVEVMGERLVHKRRNVVFG